jgi:putative Mn2+ efflux pump MntP
MNFIYDVIYLTVIAFLNSIDNLGIAVAYSISGKKIPLIKNLLISLAAFLVSYLSGLSGEFISKFLTEETSAVIAFGILVLMGANMIYHAFKKDHETEASEEAAKLNVVSNKEAIIVGTILALDDVGSSVSSGLIGHGPFMIAFPFFILSFIMFFLANYGARYTSKWKIGKKATAISGTIMILLGILRLFD